MPAALAFQGHNRLRYLITFAGGEVPTLVTLTIPNDGGATPDLLTDTLGGPLKQIARARLDGIGTVVPGALNQAQARAILLADDSTDVGNEKVPRVLCKATARDDNGTSWAVDADVDGDGDPVIVVSALATGGARGYLDVEFVGIPSA